MHLPLTWWSPPHLLKGSKAVDKADIGHDRVLVDRYCRMKCRFYDIL